MSSIDHYIERLKEKPLASSLIALSQSRTALAKLSDPNAVSAELIEREISKISSELYAFIFRQAGIKSSYSVDEGLSYAITKLGFERVKRLIFFYIAYSNEVDANASPFDKEFLGQLWMLNYSVGSTAEYWANFRSYQLGNEAFYLGMFQNIGISAFAQLEPSKHRALRDSRRKVPLSEKEVDAFGFDHYELGCAIVESWKLPSYHQTAMRYEQSHGQEAPPVSDRAHEDLLLFLYCGKYKFERKGQTSVPGKAKMGFDAYFEFDKTILQIGAERVADYKAKQTTARYSA